MIKRLLTIALLTGGGHLLTLLSLKFITKNVNNDAIAFIAELDSLSVLIVSIIAFGLQLSTTRELALLDEWKKEYYSTLEARLTLSLLLMIFGMTGYFFTKNYLFFIAPIIALNTDFALYGRGMPIEGAKIAIVRTVIPSLTLIICSVYVPDRIGIFYGISIMFAYFFTGLAVSKILKVKYFVKPSLKSLLKYFKNIDIGIARFLLIFLGIGIINVMSYFYNSNTIAVAYITLKLYMIFKGLRRIIAQSFFKELQEVSISIKVDYFAIIVGIVFLSIILFYPETLISLLFDEQYAPFILTFIILGVSGFISAFTTSTLTRLLLKKLDFDYTKNIVIAAIVSIVTGILFWFLIGDNPIFIAISILLGEITISVLNVVSLGEKNFLIDRIKISYPLMLFAIIFMVFRYFFGQSLFSLIGALFSFGFFGLVYTKKKFKSI